MRPTKRLSGGHFAETLAKEVEVPSSAASLIELEVDADAAYMYYMFENDSNYSGIKELRWEVVGGNVSCTLSSANMTPEIRAYLTDYMRLITQPFYCEGKVIPSQTLVMKPYEEGGNLINYTDDGSAVDLKIFTANLAGAREQEICAAVAFRQRNAWRQ